MGSRPLGEADGGDSWTVASEELSIHDKVSGMLALERND
jgi:hypothetical protein